MSWVSPTGFEDPDGVWFNEPRAYDEDTATLAVTFVLEWSGFLVLTLPGAIVSDKIRYYIKTNVYQNTIDIDVFKDGVWVHVFQGALEFDAWVEKAFAEGSVTKARFRTYLGLYGISSGLHEFDFWEVEVAPPPEGGGRALLPIIVMSDTWRRNKWLKRRRKIVYCICYA